MVVLHSEIQLPYVAVIFDVVQSPPSVRKRLALVFPASSSVASDYLFFELHLTVEPPPVTKLLNCARPKSRRQRKNRMMTRYSRRHDL